MSMTLVLDLLTTRPAAGNHSSRFLDVLHSRISLAAKPDRLDASEVRQQTEFV